MLLFCTASRAIPDLKPEEVVSTLGIKENPKPCFQDSWKKIFCPIKKKDVPLLPTTRPIKWLRWSQRSDFA